MGRFLKRQSLPLGRIDECHEMSTPLRLSKDLSGDQGEWRDVVQVGAEEVEEVQSGAGEGWPQLQQQQPCWLQPQRVW